jgi:hypothetical protein
MKRIRRYLTVLAGLAGSMLAMGSAAPAALALPPPPEPAGAAVAPATPGSTAGPCRRRRRNARLADRPDRHRGRPVRCRAGGASRPGLDRTAARDHRCLNADGTWRQAARPARTAAMSPAPRSPSTAVSPPRAARNLEQLRGLDGGVT